MANSFTTTPATATLPTDADNRLAKWSVTVAPASRPVTWAECQAQLRLEGSSEQSYVEGLIDAATEYAEDRMGMALISRTILATFYAGEALILPRGPLLDIDSVTDADEAEITFTISHIGHQIKILPTSGFSYPVSIVYTAGHANAAAIPATIRQAIQMHVATLYAQRSSISDVAKTIVPHSLDDFYRLKSRNVGVG